MKTAGVLALGAATAAGLGLLCVFVSRWASTPVITLELGVLCWVAVLSLLSHIKVDESLTHGLLMWMIVGSVVCSNVAMPLLPWGSDWSPSPGTVAWVAGPYAGLAVAAVAASLWPDRRVTTGHMHG